MLLYNTIIIELGSLILSIGHHKRSQSKLFLDLHFKLEVAGMKVRFCMHSVKSPHYISSENMEVCSLADARMIQLHGIPYWENSS